MTTMRQHLAILRLNTMRTRLAVAQSRAILAQAEARRGTQHCTCAACALRRSIALLGEPDAQLQQPPGEPKH